MAFDIQRTQRSLPGRGTSVPFQADVSTGQGQVVAAAGELAGAGQDLVLTLNRLQAENQLSEAKRRTDEAFNQLALDFEKDPDSTTYQERFNETMGRIQQFTPKNRLAAKAFGNLVKSQRVAGQAMVFESMFARERDTKRADVALMMTKGQFGRARNAIKSGVKDGTYTKVQAEVLIAESHEDERAFGRRVQLDALATKAMAMGDSPLVGPAKARAWLRKQTGLSNAERNEVEARLDGMVAEKVETEERRVAAADADLSKRMYADTGRTTSAEVHAANLPRTVRDPLLNSVRLRNKEIAEGKEIVTSSRTRADINTRLGFVVSGESTVEQAVAQYIRDVQQDVSVKERGADINAFFKAGEDNKDATKRQNQTILTERGKKLRDAIERSVGFIQLIKDEEREFLDDLANDAVIELNDRFRDLDFTVTDIDAFNDTLLRKYAVLSEQGAPKGPTDEDRKKGADIFFDSVLR